MEKSERSKETMNVNTVAELDERFARMAINAAKKSTPEDDLPRPKVGAVAVKHGQPLGVECRTAVIETNGRKNGQHAEFRLTSILSGGDLDGATIYTTLEPCLNRGDEKVSCVDRLISNKVARVVIGALDPDHRGLRKLAHSRTIEVALFPASLRAAARELIQEWEEYSQKERQKKAPSNPEREALRQRILEHKNESVTQHNKRSNTYGILTIVDCDEEVVTLSSNGHIFTYPNRQTEKSVRLPCDAGEMEVLPDTGKRDNENLAERRPRPAATKQKDRVVNRVVSAPRGEFCIQC